MPHLQFLRPNPNEYRSCCGFQEDNMSKRSNLMWIQSQEFFCSHTISKLTNWKCTPSCWWRCRVRFSKHDADPSELLFVCWWTPSLTITSAKMNAPHFFQEATAHKEIPTSPTVMGPDQNLFRPFVAQILTDSHTELLNVHFHSDSGNQACLRVLMIYNAKKQAKGQTRETRILWKW